MEKLQGLEATANDEKSKAALAEGNIEEFVKLMQGQVQTLQQENLGMRKQLEESNRLDRRRAIAEVVVRDANQQKRGAVQDILDGWIARGEVKLDAEDPNAEGERIRKKLGEKYPEYFAPADGTPVAGQPGSGKRPPPKGMIFPDLPPEEQQRLLADDEAMKEFIEQSRGQSTALMGRNL